MKKLEAKDKAHIKELLYGEWVFGIKDDQYKGFCGFQLWWFDKHRGVCDCCESHWTDRRKKITHYSLDKAAKILWKHRDSLYVRKKHVSEDKRIQILEQMQDVR